MRNEWDSKTNHTIGQSDTIFLSVRGQIAGLEKSSRPVNGYYSTVLKCGDPYWLQGSL